MFNRIHWLVRIAALNLILITAAVAFADAPLPIPANPNAPIPEGQVLVEEDIVLPEGMDSTRATYEAVLWPQGKVPYVFAASISTENRSRMRAAMDEWQSVTGITFMPRTSETNYLEVIEAGGNWSQIGMTGGKQQMSIFNWTTHYVIMHELAHTMGFWHEQSRPDRDQYVTINWQNIPDAQEHNFAIRASADTTGAYDFESVMHYNQFAFSSGGQVTISAKPGYTHFQGQMGQRSRLSASDIAGMRALYPQSNPPSTGPTNPTNPTTPSEPVNVIRNGSFESGAAPWTYLFNGQTRSTPTRCDGIAAAGSCSFTLGGKKATQITQTIKPNQIPGATFSAGQTYRFSFALAATDAAPSAVSAKVKFMYRDGSAQSITVPLVTDASGAFKVYSANATLNRGDVKKIKVIITGAKKSGVVSIDNIQLLAATN